MSNYKRMKGKLGLKKNNNKKHLLEFQKGII